MPNAKNVVKNTDNEIPTKSKLNGTVDLKICLPDRNKIFRPLALHCLLAFPQEILKAFPGR